MRFLPDEYQVIESLETPHFRLRKLCARDLYLDYIAVMSSIDLIRRTRGGGKWPTPQLTIEDDLIDLAWHQREFESRSSFAYTVMNLDETECLGCVYIVPPRFRRNVPENADAIVTFWVTQTSYDKGLYVELYKTLKPWVEKDWPFKNPYWANLEIPAI